MLNGLRLNCSITVVVFNDLIHVFDRFGNHGGICIRIEGKNCSI